MPRAAESPLASAKAARMSTNLGNVGAQMHKFHTQNRAISESDDGRAGHSDRLKLLMDMALHWWVTLLKTLQKSSALSVNPPAHSSCVFLPFPPRSHKRFGCKGFDKGAREGFGTGVAPIGGRTKIQDVRFGLAIRF